MADESPKDSGDKLDETIEATFPASDAPANTTETGIRVGASFAPDAELTAPNDAGETLPSPRHHEP